QHPPPNQESRMITPTDHRDAVVALHTAHTSLTPIAPLTTTFPTLDVDDAYAIQRNLTNRWSDAGRVIVGYKVGLTSAAMQRQLGVDQPDFGVLTDDMVLTGDVVHV